MNVLAMREDVYASLRKLITKSCVFDELPTKNFQEFHREFLKLFFGVMDVKIDYAKKSIELWSPKPMNTENFDPISLTESVHGNIYYDDLESTLMGCILESEFEEQFYKHFILEYGEPHNPSDQSSFFQSA